MVLFRLFLLWARVVAPLLLTSHGYASHATAIGSTGLAALVGGLGSLWAAYRIDRRGRTFWQVRGFLLSTGGLWMLAGFLQWRTQRLWWWVASW